MRLVEESLHFFEARGDFYATVWPSFELSNMSVMLGDYENARVQYKHVLRGAEDHNYDWAKVKVRKYLGGLAIIEKKYQLARSYLLETLRIGDELGMLRDQVSTLYDIATVETEIGDPLKAVWLLSFIRRHPLSDQARTFSLWSSKLKPASVVRIRELATNLLEDLESRVPHELYAAAEAAGQTDTLEDLVLRQLAN
jgi:hypothetical protein